MPLKTEFLATSVASNLLTRFSRTHEQRRIAVVAGHPGIGKTRAIEQFYSLNKGKVAVMELGEGPKGGHSSTAALNFAVQALEVVSESDWGHRRTTSFIELRNRFWELACDWARISERDSRSEDFDPASVSPRSIVFDEAQHISRSGIEALRSINDASRGGISPFPIGLIFVGNHEFALKSTANKPSVLTEAVSDRLLYSVSLDYEHVTDNDLLLYLENSAAFEPGAIDIALKYFGGSSTNRSFRTAEKLLQRLRAEVGSAPVTSTTIRHVLALA